MKTKQKMTLKALIRESRSWPTPREIADEYGLTERAVRNAVGRGYVESVRMDQVRINPESWAAWIESRHTPGRY